jgi:iron complex transport system substrate-binding protein
LLCALLVFFVRANSNCPPDAQQEPQFMRIVSLAPSVTSILLGLGAGREVVGVSRWCKHVADVGSRPQVGDCWKLDIDEVMRLRPTLLIGSVPFAPQAVSDILAQPIPFLALNPRSLADIENDIRLLARMVGREGRGNQMILKMRRDFAAVRRRAQRIAGRSRPRVYCEAWPNPRISSPAWVSEMAEIAGGKSVVPAGRRVTDEEVALARPDLVVLAWTATGDRARPRQALQNRAWKDVPAIKSGRVVVIRDELLNTPAPILVQGARALFEAIHPRPARRMAQKGSPRC